MAQGPQQQTGTHQIWVVFAVLPQIGCNLQQIFFFCPSKMPLPEFLILSLCCHLQVIKGKEKKRKKAVVLFLSVSWALLSVVHGWIMWQRRNFRSFTGTKKFLFHIQITLYLLGSSKNSKLFGAKMQLNMVLCSSRHCIDVLTKILRKFK